MAQYKVLSNLDHDNHSYKVGDLVDDSVLGDSAQELVIQGVIESVGLQSEAPQEEQVTTELEPEAVAEVPATPDPLEEASASDSGEEQEIPVEQPVETQEEQPQSVQEPTPVQPTPEQIEQDLEGLETPSEQSNDLHIS